MQISGSTVLVTGANRGIGAEFVRQLKERGAKKIYAAVRDTSTITSEPGLEVVALDVTDEAQVNAVAAQASDVDFVINNAGIAQGQTFLDGDISAIRREFETNLYGPLFVSRAFAPALAANGGGAILNVLSAVSWFAFPGNTSYSASKAATWILTDGLRIELAAQGTQVVGLHMGAVETDMGRTFPLDTVSPEQIVTAALDGVESGAVEVLADDVATTVKGLLDGDVIARYAALGVDLTAPAAV